jgi:hypothetical protein
VRPGRWRETVRGASLRTRVMAAAALLVALTCLVTGVLGTALLRSYLLSRSDAQLRDFATVASGIVARQQLQPAGSSRPQGLPADADHLDQELRGQALRTAAARRLKLLPRHDTARDRREVPELGIGPG